MTLSEFGISQRVDQKRERQLCRPGATVTPLKPSWTVILDFKADWQRISCHLIHITADFGKQLPLHPDFAGGERTREFPPTDSDKSHGKNQNTSDKRFRPTMENVPANQPV